METWTLDPSEGVEQWEVDVEGHPGMDCVEVTLRPPWDQDFRFVLEAWVRIEGAGPDLWLRMMFLAIPMNDHVIRARRV